MGKRRDSKVVVEIDSAEGVEMLRTAFRRQVTSLPVVNPQRRAVAARRAEESMVVGKAGESNK